MYQCESVFQCDCLSLAPPNVMYVPACSARSCRCQAAGRVAGEAGHLGKEGGTREARPTGTFNLGMSP